MFIPLMIEPPWIFSAAPVDILSSLFLLVIVAFCIVRAIEGFDKDLSATFNLWVVIAVLVLGFTVLLTLNDVFHIRIFDWRLLHWFSFVVLSVITVGVIGKLVRTARSERVRYWILVWVGFLIIGLSVWLWNGVFAVFYDELVLLLKVDFIPEAAITLSGIGLGLAVMAVGWIVAGAHMHNGNKVFAWKKRSSMASK